MIDAAAPAESVLKLEVPQLLKSVLQGPKISAEGMDNENTLRKDEQKQHRPHHNNVVKWVEHRKDTKGKNAYLTQG